MALGCTPGVVLRGLRTPEAPFKEALWRTWRDIKVRVGVGYPS